MNTHHGRMKKHVPDAQGVYGWITADPMGRDRNSDRWVLSHSSEEEFAMHMVGALAPDQQLARPERPDGPFWDHGCYHQLGFQTSSRKSGWVKVPPFWARLGPPYEHLGPQSPGQ